MKALVLAAGLGTRLRPYTYTTPKPLFTVAGVPMLDRIIGQLARAGCSSIMINTHHLHEKIENHVKKTSYPIEVKTVHEPLILDTGGAVKNLEKFWNDEPFFVVNADIFTDADFSSLFINHIESEVSATLLMHDDQRFNNVAVNNDYGISSFRVKDPGTGRLMAFTGIQVVSPEILDAIPENTPFSIIEAYRNLLSHGKRINAFIPEKIIWEDIGTPEAYLSISKKILARKIIDSKVEERDFEKLKGDGSDRKWYRISSDSITYVLAEHGIKNTDSTCEAESFCLIGKHLGRKGLPVPEIIEADTFSGNVLVEDLGNTHLADFVKSADDAGLVRDMYRKVISGLSAFSAKGIEGFESSWTWQTPSYSRDMVMEKECHYFRDAFLKNYLGLSFSDSELEPAFEYIAEGASSKGFLGLMHRDFQSRNIMIKNGSPCFIDYQGARKGPFQYDVASLLVDPYVSLHPDLISELEDHAFRCISAFRKIPRGEFMESLCFCRTARNFQILGAFSFLSMVKGKKNFEEYIPCAVKGLLKNLGAFSDQKLFFPFFDILEKTVFPL